MCMISWMIRPSCEITDQLAVGTQNYFSTLFYTPYINIKTSDQNAPKCTISRQKYKQFLGRKHSSSPNPSPVGEGFGEGAVPLPKSLPTGEGYSPPQWGRGIPPPQTPSLRRLRRLDYRAFGARCSPFLFIYDSNAAIKCRLLVNL